MMDGKFDLEDMLKQIEQYNKIQGSALLKLIPGMPKISDEQKEQANKALKATKAIIQSMTPEERKHPEVIKNSRKMRIAAGCGKTNADVNKVLKQYEQMKLMMKQMKNGGLGGMMGKSFPGGKMPKF